MLGLYAQQFAMVEIMPPNTTPHYSKPAFRLRQMRTQLEQIGR
jgi:hypothetical protein